MLKTYLIVFGAIVIAGGVQGYLTKGSNASLIAGGALGACLLAGAFLAGLPGLILALVGCLGVAGKFVPDYFRAGDKVAALWPGGVLAVMSVVGLVMVVQALLRR